MYKQYPHTSILYKNKFNDIDICKISSAGYHTIIQNSLCDVYDLTYINSYHDAIDNKTGNPVEFKINKLSDKRTMFTSLTSSQIMQQDVENYMNMYAVLINGSNYMDSMPEYQNSVIVNSNVPFSSFETTSFQGRYNLYRNFENSDVKVLSVKSDTITQSVGTLDKNTSKQDLLGKKILELIHESEGYELYDIPIPRHIKCDRMGYNDKGNIYLEAKTTFNNAVVQSQITLRELYFASQHKDNYFLYFISVFPNKVFYEKIDYYQLISMIKNRKLSIRVDVILDIDTLIYKNEIVNRFENGLNYKNLQKYIYLINEYDGNKLQSNTELETLFLEIECISDPFISNYNKFYEF